MIAHVGSLRSYVSGSVVVQCSLGYCSNLDIYGVLLDYWLSSKMFYRYSYQKEPSN